MDRHFDCINWGARSRFLEWLPVSSGTRAAYTNEPATNAKPRAWRTKGFSDRAKGIATASCCGTQTQNRGARFRDDSDC